MNAFTKYIYFGEHVNQSSPPGTQTSTLVQTGCKDSGHSLGFMLAVLKTNEGHLGVTLTIKSLSAYNIE